MFTSSQPLPGLVHLDFETFAQLGKALIRPQEFAESPKFHGKVFTTSEMKRVYKGTLGDPYKCLYGVNIPGECMDEFFATFPSLTTAELAVKKHLDSMNLPSRYYVIGSRDRNADHPRQKAGKHELAHALFYLDETYRKQVLAEIAKLPVHADHGIRKRLLEWGIYAPHVITDELHAYLATDSPSVRSRRWRMVNLTPDAIAVADTLRDLLDSTLAAAGWKEAA